MEMKTYHEQTSVKFTNEQRSMNPRHVTILPFYLYVKQRWLLCSVKLHLFESTGCNHIVHPLHSEASAQLDCLNVAFSRSGEGGEEEAHAEGIVDVTESINEGGVPATRRSTTDETKLEK